MRLPHLTHFQSPVLPLTSGMLACAGDGAAALRVEISRKSWLRKRAVEGSCYPWKARPVKAPLPQLLLCVKEEVRQQRISIGHIFTPCDMLALPFR